jgi:cation transport ATPase
MTGVPSRDVLRLTARHTAGILLALTASALATGLVMHAAGAGRAGNGVWLAGGLLGAGYALWAVADALRGGRIGVDVIALLAVGGAIAVRELLAAAVIAVMLASGRALEEWAAGRAHRDLRELLQRAPRIARRYRDGNLETVPLEEVGRGDRLLVAPGDLVPADGTLSTAAVLDESALTGEALPVERSAGEPVRSGVVNSGGPFDMRATAAAADSTYAGVVRLVSQAEASQPPFVRLADRYAVWFLAVSLAAAGAAWAVAGPARAVAVLVVATPCPLILAAPVAWVSGLSVAARRGVVVKDGAVLERLARCRTLLMDKTGTLTSGRPVVTAVIPAGGHEPAEVLRLAASLDQVSGHVLATAVTGAAARGELSLTIPREVAEVAGQGIRGTVADHQVAVGKASWVGVTGGLGQGGAAPGQAGWRADGVRRHRPGPGRGPGADRPGAAGRGHHYPGATPVRHQPDRHGHGGPGRRSRDSRRSAGRRRGAGRARARGQAGRGPRGAPPRAGDHDRGWCQ